MRIYALGVFRTPSASDFIKCLSPDKHLALTCKQDPEVWLTVGGEDPEKTYALVSCRSTLMVERRDEQ
eukprot:scaffold353_cov185-Amphora_coffeaeformis.AAC.82